MLRSAAADVRPPSPIAPEIAVKRLPIALAVTFSMTLASAATAAPPPAYQASIAQLQQRMDAGSLSSRALARQFIERIRQIDRSGPSLHSVIELNPDALSLAAKLDQARGNAQPRGPMYGIPVLLKDNVDTGDRMLTTAGSLALADAPAPRDAGLVARLRKAGALILGKTNLSEWANFRSNHASSGWSGRGGLTRNPYVLDRNPCGSSAGSGSSGRRRPGHGGHRHRDRWLDHLPGGLQRHRRHQADPGVGQSQRHRADQPQPGHCWPDGTQRCRRGRPAQRHRRQRPA